MEALDLLKNEMRSVESHIKVNARHRLKIVAALMTEQEIIDNLIPYLLGIFI